MKKWFLFFVMACFPTILFAYEATDQTAIMIITPSDWSYQKMGQTENSINFQLKNKLLQAPNIEIITYSILKKADNNAEANVNGLYSGLKDSLQNKGNCIISELKVITNNRMPFKEWVSYYQCPSHHLVGMIVIADADPVNMYLFSYQISANLPHENMLNKLADIVKICYKKNPDPTCYFLLKE
jgi:hypothetical protein